MNQLWRDVVQGARGLRKDPGFALVAVLTLALGIGANTTVFSWINATLLDPIPGATEPGKLIAMARGHAGSFAYPDYLDLRQGSKEFSSMAAATLCPMSFTGRDRPERVWGSLVSANYFDVLGVRPALGRGFAATEEAPERAPSVVISYRVWQDRFSGARDVLGRTLPINSHEYTIVGVAPAEFQGSYTGLRMDVWVPLAMTAEVVPGAAGQLEARNDQWLNLYGRLRPGADVAQAQAEIGGLFQRLAAEYPDSHKGRAAVTLYPLWRSPNGANGVFSQLLPLLLGIAGVVLLLACANLANLVLARGIGRHREMAIRLSLGASRGRLIRQLVAENLVLAAAGGAVALGATVWAAGSFMKFAPVSNLPVWLPIPVDHRVFAATLVVSLVATFLFGSLPALRTSAMDPVNALKEETASVTGGRRGRLSRGLAIAQIAFSLLLLVCAGLLVESFRAARNFDPGFNPRNVLLESYDLFPAGYTEAQGDAFNRQVLEKARALPGAKSAALADWVPLGFGSNEDDFVPEGYAAGKNEAVAAGIARVSPGYLATMEIPLEEGRDFSPADTEESAPVVIINRAVAARYWPGQEAVGKRLKIEGKWATVAGVARTTHYYDLVEPPRPFIYLPLEQFYTPGVTLHVRLAGEPLGAAAEATRMIHELNAGLAVFDVSTLEARITPVTYGLHMAGTFSGAFGLLALALAGVGIYGVVACSTRQRTREFGVRMALGAQRADVMRLILRQGLTMLLAGTAAGLAASLAATRLLGGLLYGVTATDPLTYLGVTGLLAAATLVACYLPARRAVRVDPLEALRHE
ncbi:MAG TPA: ABC transporter permease [Candidatus Acidoferrales bacterium]|nr:ABC transporter permease [Candidatus Acidoferrales bacterium]